MNREQKAATIDEIAAQIQAAQAILAVDYRGISVPQVAELRAGLRQADASFRVVKNSLTERAADKSGAETLKPLLIGPTALAFVRGDVATAAKTIADYGRSIQLLPFKGGLMDGAELDAEQIRALSRLPARDVLYGQLVGMVASPVSGLVRSLGALLGGLAVALGQVRDKMQSGEIASAAAPAGPDSQDTAGAPAETPAGQSQAGEPEQASADQSHAGEPEQASADESQAGEPEQATAEPPPPDAEADAAAQGSAETQAQPPPQGEAEAQAPETSAQEDRQAAHAEAAQAAAQDQTEPAQEPASPDDEADASTEEPTSGADQSPAKED
jgi:large subunit ribosomal protein L10